MNVSSTKPTHVLQEIASTFEQIQTIENVPLWQQSTLDLVTESYENFIPHLKGKIQYTNQQTQTNLKIGLPEMTIAHIVEKVNAENISKNPILMFHKTEDLSQYLYTSVGKENTSEALMLRAASDYRDIYDNGPEESRLHQMGQHTMTAYIKRDHLGKVSHFMIFESYPEENKRLFNYAKLLGQLGVLPLQSPENRPIHTACVFLGTQSGAGCQFLSLDLARKLQTEDDQTKQFIEFLTNRIEDPASPHAIEVSVEKGIDAYIAHLPPDFVFSGDTREETEKIIRNYMQTINAALDQKQMIVFSTAFTHQHAPLNWFEDTQSLQRLNDLEQRINTTSAAEFISETEWATFKEETERYPYPDKEKVSYRWLSRLTQEIKEAKEFHQKRADIDDAIPPKKERPLQKIYDQYGLDPIRKIIKP